MSFCPIRGVVGRVILQEVDEEGGYEEFLLRMSLNSLTKVSRILAKPWVTDRVLRMSLNKLTKVGLFPGRTFVEFCHTHRDLGVDQALTTRQK